MFDTHSTHLDHALVTRGDRGYVGHILKNIFKLYFVANGRTWREKDVEHINEINPKSSFTKTWAFANDWTNRAQLPSN